MVPLGLAPKTSVLPPSGRTLSAETMVHAPTICSLADCAATSVAKSTVPSNSVNVTLAAAVMALPLMVRAIRQSLEAVDSGLEAAARTLGASRARVFATVTVPLMAPGLLSGAVLGFAASLGEFGATITFVSNVPGETQTLPLAIYSALQQPGGDDAAARLVMLAVLLALAALATAQWCHRRVQRWVGQVQ